MEGRPFRVFSRGKRIRFGTVVARADVGVQDCAHWVVFAGDTRQTKQDLRPILEITPSEDMPRQNLRPHVGQWSWLDGDQELTNRHLRVRSSSGRGPNFKTPAQATAQAKSGSKRARTEPSSSSTAIVPHAHALAQVHAQLVT